jgi:hypothetical protein
MIGGTDDLPAHRQVAAGPQRGSEACKQRIHRPRPLESLAKGPGRVGIGHRRSASPRPRKRMKDSRSLIRYSQRSSDNPCMAASSRTLNISTWPKAGRPPLLPSDRAIAYSNLGRNRAKSTRAAIRSRSSPLGGQLPQPIRHIEEPRLIHHPTHPGRNEKSESGHQQKGKRFLEGACLLVIRTPRSHKSLSEVSTKPGKGQCSTSPPRGL